MVNLHLTFLLYLLTKYAFLKHVLGRESILKYISSVLMLIASNKGTTHTGLFTLGSNISLK